jgi:phosphoserine phosphatase
VDRLSGYRTRCLMSLPLMAVDGGLVGVLQVLNKATGVFDGADVALGEALAAQCAVALARSRMLAQAREAERVARELAVAQLVQTSALPQQPPCVVGYAMHAVFRPAAQTGGDAYDFALIGDRLLLLLADAAGHGVGPALSVMQMQAMLRMGLRLGASLETIYLEVNNRLTEILPDGHFVTAFVGLLDPASHRLRFISGGQSPILHHVAADDTFSIHKATTFPMGAMLLDAPRTPVEFTLSPGDSLALLSDGIFEAEDASGERFGRGRVEALLRTGAGQPLAETARALIDSVDAHLGGMPQDDDITAVLLRRER